MSRLGFGWMGSKNKIAQELIAQLPAADVFVDLFAGGCAMTHAAILSGKYKRFIANDIKGTAVFFKQAIEGKVENLYEWISREEFFARRDHDVKVMSAWSFGNNGRSYLWAYDIENIKLAAFKMLTLPTVEERYAAYKEFVTELGKYNKVLDLKQIESIARLQSMERLRSLQSLQALNGVKRLEQLRSDALTVYDTDYCKVPIPSGAVVYCDPPYSATYAPCKDYWGAHIDGQEFWRWVDAQSFPVFVSEYTAPAGFAEVWSTQKRCTLGSAAGAKPTTERLFVQERFADRFCRQEVQPQPELLEATA